MFRTAYQAPAQDVVCWKQRMNNTGVVPIQDRVMVRRDLPSKQTKSGLYVPEQWPTTGTVLAVGPQVKEHQIHPGVRVFFKPRPSSALIPDDREPGERDHKEWERVVMLREEDIIGIVVEE